MVCNFNIFHIPQVEHMEWVKVLTGYYTARDGPSGKIRNIVSSNYAQALTYLNQETANNHSGLYNYITGGTCYQQTFST